MSYSNIRRQDIKPKKPIWEYTPLEYEQHLQMMKAKWMGLKEFTRLDKPMAKPEIPHTKCKEKDWNYNPAALQVSKVTQSSFALQWKLQFRPSVGNVEFRIYLGKNAKQFNIMDVCRAGCRC